jgi:hypothetical protein
MKTLSARLQLHSRQIEDFISLLEQTVIDGGEGALTSHATEIISQVADDMLRTDSTVLSLMVELRKVVISTVNHKFGLVTKQRVEKAVEEAVTKAALQAKLEMVSFVLASHTRAPGC